MLLRPLGDVIVVMPPLAIEDELLGRVVDAVYEAVREVGERPPRSSSPLTEAAEGPTP